MPTFRSIKEYRTTLARRIRRMDKMESPKNAARFHNLTSKRTAPIRTGETVRGLRMRKIKKNTWASESMVTPKGRTRFMQNFWANRTPPHHAPTMVWNRNQPTVYGIGPFRWTGLPGFFDHSTRLTRREYPQIMVREMHKILGSK